MESEEGKRVAALFGARKRQIYMQLCKLLEESDIVFNEQADVSDAVFAHGYAFDAETEGPAAVLFGVDVAGFEDVGVDHAAAAELDPLLLVFEPDVDLGGGLGEGE